MKTQIVVIAKEPLPGRVKTRLCPPCTPEQAAALAQAALDDTIETVSHTPVSRRVLLLDGTQPRPVGWEVLPQRGEGLGERLANGFSESALPGVNTLLIGMDTPQVNAQTLQSFADGLSTSDAVLGYANDGGWWALALREPHVATVLAGVPMSQPDTAELTRKALISQGLSVVTGSMLRDVDMAEDVASVAAVCPGSRFAAMARSLGLA